MTPTTPDSYVTLTPYGRVDAVFGDEAGVTLRGSDDAVAHVLSTMAAATNSRGMTMTVDSVNSNDYMSFCRAKGADMVVLEPSTVALDEGAGGSAALDAASENWHTVTMEAMKRKDDAALRYILKDATEAAEAGEKIGNPKAGQYRDEAHYASMELARRRKGGKRIMDAADEDADDEGEDFDAEAEFNDTPAEDTEDGAKLDGDFAGHPFRGNQHRKASRESGSAVGASIKAKRAESKGDRKAAKSAHKSAHYAHMAASVEATGKARKYHRTMAKFHGSRAGVKLDSVGAALDAVSDVPGLRRKLMKAPTALSALMLARAIVEARATPESIAGPSYPFKGSADALALLGMSAAGDAAQSAYRTAKAIDEAIDSTGFDGVVIRWAAVDPEQVPTFDAASGSLFGDQPAGGYLRGDVSFKGRTFASVYVREDGSAAVSVRPGFEALTGWVAQVEAVAEEFSGWVSGELEADAIAEALSGTGRGSAGGLQYSSLADVVADAEGSQDMPPPDDPEYRAGPAERRGSVVRALKRDGFVEDQFGGLHLAVNADNMVMIKPRATDGADGEGGTEWLVSRMVDGKVIGEKLIPDAPGTGPVDMANILHMEANAIAAPSVDAEAAMAVARTILQQLGGSKFKVMTGAKNFMTMREGNGGLQFSLPSGFSQKNGKSTGINRVRITLNSGDTYDVEFGSARAKAYRVVATTEDVYADTLAEVFTRYTGLDVSLGSAGPKPDQTDRKAAEEIYSALYYQLDSQSGSTDTERMRPEVEQGLVEKIDALRALVDGGQWPARSPMDPQALLTRADSVLQGIRALKAAGGPEWVGRGDAMSYYVTAAMGLSREQIEAILNKPDDVTRSGSIDVPRYKVANLKAAVAAALAQNTPAPEAFEHNGRRIYPVSIRGETQWAVETDDNKARVANGQRALGGDSLSKTREGAIQQAEEMDAERERQAKWRADVDAAEKVKAEALAERNDMDGFGDNLSALARGAAVVALNQIQRFNGSEMTRKAFIRQAVAEGAAVQAHPQDVRRLVFKTTSYMTQADIGKTAMDYAEFLIAKKGGGTPAPGAPTAQYLAYEKAINAGEFTVGMGQVMRMDTRLDDGEYEKLMALVGAITPAKDPQPDPAPPVDQQRAGDLAALQQVADGTHPDMLSPETADLIENVLMRYPGDAEVEALADRAVTAYSNGLMAATT